MDESALRTYVERARAVVGAAPPSTVAETRRWLVEPLLGALGWDVRSSSCETDVAIAGAHLAYALSVDGTPALFVAVTASSGRPADDERDLRNAMAATGVDRAILTDGRRLAILAGTDPSDRFVCSVDELPAHVDAIDRASKGALEDRLSGQARRRAARRIAVDRDELARRIADDLSAVAGAGGAIDVESAADAFLADLVAAALEDPAARESDRTTDTDGEPSRRSNDDSGQGEPFPSPGDAPLDGTGPIDTHGGATLPGTSGDGDPSDTLDDATPADTPGDGDPSDDDTGGRALGTESDEERVGEGARSADAPTTDDDGEYVVRFFGDQGSIGAIGHADSASALAAAAEFLFERGLSGIRVPWRPEGGDRTVLNDRPVAEDGTAMAEYRKLSNGYVLDTAGTVADRGRRAEALAERAGFRAMLTGDWETSDPSRERDRS